MKEQIISFETAKFAHKAHFKIGQFYCYDENGKLDSLWGQDDWITFGYFDGSYLAPVQSILQKWLRENFKVDITIHRSFSMKNSYHYCIIIDCKYVAENQQVCIPGRTYEEALEDALFESLKLI